MTDRQLKAVMTYAEFTATLNNPDPPTHLSPCLLALWHERRGDWNTAHEIVQDIETSEAAAVHAYLHRREGDLANAQYWYRRAGRHADLTLPTEQEWEKLAQEML